MKVKIIFFLLIITLSLFSLTIIDQSKSFEISLDELSSFQQAEKNTQREKNGKMRKETWYGADLNSILKEYHIEDFDQMRFTSADNYQVRLTKQKIVEYLPIIALQKNDTKLEEDKIRLIVPQISDMFWIQGISQIVTEEENKMPLPNTLFTAEPILDKMAIVPDPAPFVDVQGYYLRDLLADVFPMLQTEFLLISADGVSHKLDFDQFLKNAVLILDDNKYNLQSSDMPGGMWIKNLAFIQMFDRVIFFQDQFSNWHDLAKLAGWKEKPQILLDQNGNKIDLNISFDDPQWQNIEKLTWKK